MIDRGFSANQYLVEARQPRESPHRSRVSVDVDVHVMHTIDARTYRIAATAITRMPTYTRDQRWKGSAKGQRMYMRRRAFWADKQK